MSVDLPVSATVAEHLEQFLALDMEVESQLELLWNVLDHSEVAAYWKDLDGVFLGANANLLSYLDCETPADLIGKTDYHFFDPEIAAGQRIDDAEVTNSGIAKRGITETLFLSDGHVETFNTSKIPFRNKLGQVIGIVGCFQVVTEAIATEQALRSLEERYEMARSFSQVGMWEFDLAARTLEISQPFADMVQLDASHGLKIKQDEIESAFCTVSPNNLDVSAIRSVLAGANVDLTSQWSNPDGSTRWLNYSGFPVKDETGKVTRVMGLTTDITERVKREQELRHRELHDDLTGLPNRQVLLERVELAIKNQAPLSLINLDLDHFKLVNDSLGHQAGDDLLQAVAGRLTDLISSDQLLARLGGDEFAIAVPNSVRETAEELGQRVLAALAEPLLLNGTEIYITGSVGVATTSTSTQVGQATEILRNSGVALHSAKGAGSGCVRMFHDSMRAETEAELHLRNSIHGAVGRQEFVLHYQPIMDSETSSMTAVEALIRWMPSEGDLLMPAAFLPYLERTGLIVDVGQWVIYEAVGQLARWRKEHATAKNLKMSLNLSRTQFGSEALFDVITAALADHALDPESLIVEVTETAISQNVTTMVATLQRLREVGVQVAIDDFGVGQSSLTTLFELPADILKMDRGFVSQVEGHETQPMVDAVLALARLAGLQATAEGIETEVQRSYLAEAGCDSMQGYFLGRPMTAAKLADQFL